MSWVHATEVHDIFIREWRKHEKNDFGRYKSFAINFSHVNEGDEARIEIRAVRPQASMNVFVRQIDLFQHRFDYLATLDHPIPLAPMIPVEPLKVDIHKLTPPVSAQDALRAFYQYVRESGLRWRDHRDYLWPQWISGGELEKFESSPWFENQEMEAGCEARLKA